jgi:hypothetical protein
VNSYALPLGDLTMDVYGTASGTGIVNYADGFAGVPLGTLVLSSNLGFGKDASFDVTSFVSNATVPYIGFNLRSQGTDILSSRPYNYCHVPQLLVTFVPEPSTILLAIAPFGTLPTRRSKSVPRNRG